MINFSTNNNNCVLEFYNSVKTRLDYGDVIQNAINLAYRDLQRTLRGFNNCKNKKLIKNKVSVLIKSEYETILQPDFDGKNFDKWHLSLCMRMKNIFQNDYQFTYGQAQKWINMFLKYMYLVDDRMNSILRYLHIPIDNVILDGIEKHSCYFPLQKLVPSCRPWSKMDDYSTYLDFQKEFSRLFPFPILHEFGLWNQWSKKNYRRFEDLTAFLDYFANTKQEFYFLPSLNKEVKNREETIIKYPVYSQECNNFLAVLSRYSVSNYQEVLDKNGLKYREIEDLDYKNQDDLIILSLLTALTRSMYFGNDCDLEQYAKNGIIYKMLYRLREIDNMINET